MGGFPAERTVRPHFLDPHGEQPMNFAGMLPRVQVSAVTEQSPALGWVLPGDVIESVSTGKEQNTLESPSVFGNLMIVPFMRSARVRAIADPIPPVPPLTKAEHSVSYSGTLR